MTVSGPNGENHCTPAPVPQRHISISNMLSPSAKAFPVSRNRIPCRPIASEMGNRYSTLVESN